MDLSYIIRVKAVLDMTKSKGEQTAPRFTLDKKFKVASGKDVKETAEFVVCEAKLRYHHSTITLRYYLEKKCF